MFGGVSSWFGGSNRNRRRTGKKKKKIEIKDPVKVLINPLRLNTYLVNKESRRFIFYFLFIILQ